MFHVRKIESFDSPELQPYATMRRSRDHEQQGIFIAEGTKVVQRLLESNFTILSIVLPESRHCHNRLLHALPRDFAVSLAGPLFTCLFYQQTSARPYDIVRD